MNSSDSVKVTGDSPGLVDRPKRISSMSLFVLVVFAFLLAGSNRGCADMGDGGISAASGTPQSFSIYALSRGKGVPEQARKVLEEARTLLQSAQKDGVVTRLIDQRIGLEGETRLCAEFRDVDSARKFFARIQDLGQEVDLINVKNEPCPQ